MNLVYFNDLIFSLLLLHPSPCMVYHGLTPPSNTDCTLNILGEKNGQSNSPSDHWYSSNWNGCNWKATLFFVQIFLLKIELILGNGVYLISYYDESYDSAIVRSSLIDKFSLVRLDDIRPVLNNWIDDITSRVVQPPALTEELRWRIIVPSRLKSFVVSKAKINQKDGGGGFP